MVNSNIGTSSGRKCYPVQRIFIYLLRGSITVWLTSCFICLDSADLLWLNQQLYLFGRIQTSQRQGQPYTDTFPYEILLRN